MKRLRLEVKDAGGTENEPDWFVPPMGGSPVRTQRSKGIRKQLRSLSTEDRRKRLKAGEALARGSEPSKDPTQEKPTAALAP